MLGTHIVMLVGTHQIASCLIL